MLPFVLMLLSDPLAPLAPGPMLEPEIRLRAFDGLIVPPCAELGYQRIERSPGQRDRLLNDLTYAPNGQVRHYLLLDRSIRGCPAPISYSLPARQGGFIRDLTAPAVRAPDRRPSDDQPSRSSE